MKAWDLIPGNVREKKNLYKDPTYFQKAKQNTLCTQRSNCVGRMAKIFLCCFFPNHFSSTFNLFFVLPLKYYSSVAQLLINSCTLYMQNENVL